MIETAFTRLVGCEVPLQQAPMGSVSSPELAVAVAEAGGVGTITALGMDADQLARMLDTMRAQTDGVLAVNFLTDDVDPGAVEAAGQRVRLVEFFWSDPDPARVELVHAQGALAGWQVGSLADAGAAVAAGCDVVAVQGVEAGGHVRGDEPLLPLLARVLDEVDVPVLAAGGIATGRAVAAVLAAGAAGARIGTRFIATQESGAHPAYKQAVVDAGPGATEVTGEFAVCPLCATLPRARVLRRCIDAMHATADEVVGEVVMAGEPVPVPRGSGMPPGATATGRIEAMAMYAGAAADAVGSIAPAADVVRELVTQAAARLEARGRS